MYEFDFNPNRHDYVKFKISKRDDMRLNLFNGYSGIEFDIKMIITDSISQTLSFTDVTPITELRIREFVNFRHLFSRPRKTNIITVSYSCGNEFILEGYCSVFPGNRLQTIFINTFYKKDNSHLKNTCKVQKSIPLQSILDGLYNWTNDSVTFNLKDKWRRNDIKWIF